MATVDEVLALWKAVDVEAIAEGVIDDHVFTLENIQEEQLYAGQDKEGNDLSPTYFTDPYFPSPEAARAYSEWKDRITPPDNSSDIYAPRKSGVPNLCINGYWYSGLKFDPKAGVFTNTNELNPKIIDKYPNALGLNPTGLRYYTENFFSPRFYKQFRIAIKQ